MKLNIIRHSIAAISLFGLSSLCLQVGAVETHYMPSPTIQLLPANMEGSYISDNKAIEIDIVPVSHDDKNYNALKENEGPALQISSFDAIMSEDDMGISEHDKELSMNVYTSLKKAGNLDAYVKTVSIDGKSKIDFNEWAVLNIYTLTPNKQLETIANDDLVSLSMQMNELDDGEEVNFILMSDENNGTVLPSSIVQEDTIKIKTNIQGTLLLLVKTNS